MLRRQNVLALIVACRHASIAECWMAFGILTDDRARYNKALQLFHTTVAGYFKWGRGRWAANRLIGESTETLRDIYHTLFGGWADPTACCMFS
jgi:hypothetical protein